MTAEQTQILKDTHCKGMPETDFRLFIAQCERTGLDPFTRQIYPQKRRTRDRTTNEWVETWSAQVSIDGFRVIAERTGELDGQEVAWCGKDGVWRDVWLDDTPPAAAKVLVYRKGCSKPFPAIAKFAEYVQTNRDGAPTGMWSKMSANQLAKCSESLALRKAFPAMLSGLYTHEEMAQAENSTPMTEVSPAVEPAPPEAVVNVETGELVPTAERPTPPDGYGYIERCWLERGWYHAIWQGTEYKTKQPQIGETAMQTFQMGVPVKCMSKKAPWLDRVESYRPPETAELALCVHCGELPSACTCDVPF